MSALVEVEGLSKSFGTFKAVDGISFNVERGEVLGFLGPNGAGKSTTMKMITGFLTPNAGTARIAGFDIGDAPIEAKRRIGYLPEGAPLYPDMTPLTLLDFVGQIRGLAPGPRKAAIDSVIQRVHLEKVLHQTLDTLSKGYKRRVGLAQAILHDPEVLILDEPTDGLDPNQKFEVRELIGEMSDDKAIILSTHILEEVDAVCSRTIVIAGGRVVADGTPADLEARSEWHNAVSLSLSGVAESDVRSAFSSLGGVKGIEILGSTDRSDQLDVVVFPSGNQSLATGIADILKQQGWHASRLHVERGRLDDVFRDITLGQQARG